MGLRHFVVNNNNNNSNIKAQKIDCNRETITKFEFEKLLPTPSK